MRNFLDIADDQLVYQVLIRLCTSLAEYYKQNYIKLTPI